MPPNMKGVPSHWLNYFAVTDCDASAKKVTELGGKVVMPPMDIPNIGRFAICAEGDFRVALPFGPSDCSCFPVSSRNP